MNILISACLLGLPCRYDGKAKPWPGAEELKKRHTLIPFCPECCGGLPTPREPSEIRGSRVVSRTGCDVTDAYRRGAEEALAMCRMFACRCAVLKEKSPSCGCGKIYDGTFTGTLTDGDGITAALLKENGIRVYMVNGDFQYLISFAEELITTQVFGEQPENLATSTITGMTFDSKSYHFNETDYAVQ